MDAGTSGGTTMEPAKSALIEDCLKLLRGESDSQRLSGLLLVTKVCKKDDHSAILQLYQAIGSQFLLRLVRTGLRKNRGGNGGEHLDANLELSVGVLAAFCRVSEIAASPEMLPVVPLLLQIIRKGSYPSMIKDCFEFLYLVINAQEDGARSLFESGGIQLFASQIPSLSDGSPLLNFAMELVELVISKLPAEEIYIKHSFEMAMLVVGVAQKFGSLHTDLKIKALDLLTGILSSKHKAPVCKALRSMNDSVWSTYIRAGVVAILNSRVAPVDRLNALLLADCTISIVGEDWLIGPVELPEVKDLIHASSLSFVWNSINALKSFYFSNAGCLQLVFKTSRVEIAVLLNDLAYLRDKASKGSAVSPETVNVKFRSLALMFSLTERVIKLTSKFGDKESHPNATLSDSILKNIRSGLNETVSAVLDYLQDAKKRGQNKGNDLRDSVRIISICLAETPDTCSEKVKELLSYMLSVQGEDDPSPFRSACSLMPMLCQKTLSLDGCKYCISAGVYKPVIEYLFSLIGSSSKVEDDGAVYLACYPLVNILGVRHTLSNNIRSQIEDGMPFKLLGPLSRWAMGTKKGSNLLMAGAICAIMLDSTSEKALKLHPDFSRADLNCLSKLLKKSLAVTSLGARAHSDLHQIVSTVYSRSAHKFPSIKKVVMRVTK